MVDHPINRIADLLPWHLGADCRTGGHDVQRRPQSGLASTIDSHPFFVLCLRDVQVITMSAAQIPPEFFTVQSMGTLTGAAGATYTIANGLQSAINFNPRWLALVIAEVLCAFGVFASHPNGALGSDYFIGVVNGFLVYWTAAGATSMSSLASGRTGSKGGAVPRGPGSRTETTAGRRAFSTPWF